MTQIICLDPALWGAMARAFELQCQWTALQWETGRQFVARFGNMQQGSTGNVRENAYGMMRVAWCALSI